MIAFERAVAQDSAARDFVVGREAEPGTKMFLIRPLGHIGADFRVDTFRC